MEIEAHLRDRTEIENLSFDLGKIDLMPLDLDRKMLEVKICDYFEEVDDRVRVSVEELGMLVEDAVAVVVGRAVVGKSVKRALDVYS